MVGTITKTVATAGSPEPLVAPPAALPGPQTGFRVTWCTIQALLTNTGNIKIRAPLVSSPVGYTIVSPGDSLVLWAPSSLHLAIDLTEIFIDPTINGEGVSAIFVK